MESTSLTLLEKIRDPSSANSREMAWSRFVELYTPMMLVWVRRLGTQEADAADLVQDVFTILLQRLPEFRYDGSKRFRGWLRTVIVNRWRNWKASAPVGMSERDRNTRIRSTPTRAMCSPMTNTAPSW